MNKLFLLSIVLPEPALLTHISALPSIPCFDFCAVVLPPRMNFLLEPIRESFCESSLSVCLPAVLPISLVDIAQHTSAYTHNCISYSNTHNTGCPVLGVHITIKKDWIENLVVLEIRKKLEDARFIDDIVHAFMEFQTAENTVIPHLKQSLAELNKSIDNILAAIEQGIFTQSTKQRLEELESKKKDIEIEIAKESIRRPLLNEDQVRFWFERLRNLNINELSHRKRLIDTFLNSVFVCDDKLLINCNYPNTSAIVRFSDINATFNGSDILACGRPHSEAKKDIMASNPRNLTISGVFLAFPRFFAIMRFADTECRKKDIISKKRLWTGFEPCSTRF